MNSVTPDNGPMDGEQDVSIDGLGFNAGIDRVLFGGEEAQVLSMAREKFQ